MSGAATELLRCPFCGGEPELRDDYGAIWVCCTNCTSDGPWVADDAALAIAGWNRRAPTPSDKEQTE